MTRCVLVLEIIEIIFLDDGGGPVSSVKDNPWSEHKHELQPSRHSLIFLPQKRSEQNRTSCPSRNTKSSCFNEFIVYLYICKYHDVIRCYWGNLGGGWYVGVPRTNLLNLSSWYWRWIVGQSCNTYCLSSPPSSPYVEMFNLQNC